MGLARFGFHEQTTLLVFAFDQDLDPGPAQDPGNYLLLGPGRDGRLGTRDDVPIAIGSATYDPTTRGVTLVPANRLLKLWEHYRLTVNGTDLTGLTCATGIFLARANGRPGTSFVASFNRHALAGPSELFGPDTSPRALRRQAGRARLAANRLLRQAIGGVGAHRALSRLQANPHGGRPQG